MFKIVEAAFIAPGIKRFLVEAPRVAFKHQPGQFVIVRLHQRGERIPLTIEKSDPARGAISLVVQSAGKTTAQMNSLEEGENILDLVGPLGKPSHIARYGTVAVVSGGVGTAMAYPTAAALKQAGNRVIAIVGARTRDLVILEEEMKAVADRLLVTTDDGSYGRPGLVTDALREIMAGGLHLVLAVGPLPMMKAVADTTRAAAIPTIVSLNPLMIDGTGMCGGCRVLVAGASRFACVDGPEFDAHQVDFDTLMRRNTTYRECERLALERYRREASAAETVPA
jgi:ferredoxin/flavodoxin---NADP+ reductase